MGTVPDITVLPTTTVSPGAISVTPSITVSPGGLVLPTAYSECKAWWPAAPVYGNITPSNGSAQSLDLASTSGLTLDDNGGAGYPDPDGGMNAWRITESVGGTTHYLSVTLSNVIQSYGNYRVWYKPETGGRDWMLQIFGSNDYGYFNFDTGADTGGTGAWSVVDEGVASSGRWARFQDRDQDALSPLYLYLANSTPTHVYSGDGRVAGYIYVSGATNGFTQSRVQQTDDQSGTGAHLTEATGTKQMLLFDETLNSIVVPHVETGRLSGAGVTDATVAAVVNGTDTSYAVLGIFGIPGGADSSRPCWFWVAGYGNYVSPFYISGANLRSARVGASGSSNRDLTYNGEFATPKAYAYIYNGATRVGTLYIAGVLAYTWAAHSAVGVVTCDSMHQGSHYVTTAPDELHGDLCLMNAVNTYEYYQPALQGMARPFGLVA